MFKEIYIYGHDGFKLSPSETELSFNKTDGPKDPFKKPIWSRQQGSLKLSFLSNNHQLFCGTFLSLGF